MFRRIDDAQLRAWQHVANHLNWNVGVSHFTGARLAVVIYTAANLTTFINQPRLWSFLVALLAVMFLPMGFWWISDTERMCRKSGFANPQKVFPASYVNRMMQTLISALTLTGNLMLWAIGPGDVGILALYVFAYLIAADMPPQKPVEEPKQELAPQAG